MGSFFMSAATVQVTAESSRACEVAPAKQEIV
jgi:hypothetical protein